MYLFPENWFRLSTISLLFPIVPSSSLGGLSFLGLLILGYFVQLVFLALLAVCTPLLWYVHLNKFIIVSLTFWNTSTREAYVFYWSRLLLFTSRLLLKLNP